MIIPSKPQPGLVVSYSYLWADQRHRGEVAGRKDRPAAIVLVRTDIGPSDMVYVVPITHQKPDIDDGSKIAIPQIIKDRIGLDRAPSWIDVTEVNIFVWPGYDLRPTNNEIRDKTDTQTCVYGFLPSRFFEKIKQALDHQRKLSRVKAVKR